MGFQFIGRLRPPFEVLNALLILWKLPYFDFPDIANLQQARQLRPRLSAATDKSRDIRIFPAELFCR